MAYSQTEDYSIFCIYSFLSACTKGQIFVKGWGSPKGWGATQESFCFCISRGEVDVREEFSILSFCKVIVRRNTSFYNKEVIFSAGEGAVKFQMHVVDWLNVELFLFQLILRTVRSFYLMNYFHVMNDFLLFFWNFYSILSNECFNQQWATSMFIFLHVFMYSELSTTIYNILYACFTVHYSPLNIIFPLGIG